MAVCACKAAYLKLVAEVTTQGMHLPVLLLRFVNCRLPSYHVPLHRFHELYARHILITTCSVPASPVLCVLGREWNLMCLDVVMRLHILEQALQVNGKYAVHITQQVINAAKRLGLLTACQLQNHH